MYDRERPRLRELGINPVSVALKHSFVALAVVTSMLPGVLGPSGVASQPLARCGSACARFLSVYLRYPSVDFGKLQSTMK